MDAVEPMSVEPTEVKPKNTRKPKGKTSEAKGGKRGLNLSLPQEVYERLALHALADGKTISELVSELAITHLRRVHMVRKTDAA